MAGGDGTNAVNQANTASRIWLNESNEPINIYTIRDGKELFIHCHEGEVVSVYEFSDRLPYERNKNGTGKPAYMPREVSATDRQMLEEAKKLVGDTISWDWTGRAECRYGKNQELICRNEGTVLSSKDIDGDGTIDDAFFIVADGGILGTAVIEGPNIGGSLNLIIRNVMENQ